jgi:glycosyltransferase involved in cell wall biosynthesis
VAVFAGASIGGTEKGATIYAAGLAERGYPVDYVSREGPRSSHLRNCGVRCIDSPRDEKDVCDYLSTAQPAIIHQHVAGYPTPNLVYPALRILKRSGRPMPKLIETNIFGRLEEPESDCFTVFRMFISAASAAQAFRRAGIRLSPEQLERQTVLYYPVPPPEVSRFTIPAEQRRAVRLQLGVSETEVLAVRVGQPGHKWNSSEAHAFRLAKSLQPDLALRMLLMEPPPHLQAATASGRFGRGIIVRPATSDFEWLESVYAASDLMIHASDWGESFGYTIAEGMAAGLPIITRSTPWGDNAQVELVQNGQTGFVCRSIAEMARRLVDLSSNDELRNQLGHAGRERILALADPQREIGILEEIIHLVMHGVRGPNLEQRGRDLLAYAKEFPSAQRDFSERLSEHFRDGIAGTLYSRYRLARSRSRSILNRIRRKQLGWHPRPLRSSRDEFSCERIDLRVP